MEQLRIQRKDLYEIQVNDNGDTIVFQLGDLTLADKLNQAYEEIRKVQEELRQKILIINKKKDFKPKNSIITNNQLAVSKAQKEAFLKMRKAIDLFLGEGGCQKVFGDDNYYEMFNDLFEALEEKDENGLSHLDKMGISKDSIDKRIKEKYKDMQTRAQVI